MNKKLILFLALLIFAGVTQAQWQPDVRLTNDSANSVTSFNSGWCIAASGNTLHVVWYDDRDGNDEIYYKRSTDGGTSWSADIRLTNNSQSSENPSVAVSGANIHVAWHDNRDGNLEIYYKRSTDGGLTWGADTRLSSSPGLSARPSVAVSGSDVQVTWDDDRDGNWEIHHKRSIDGGLTWGTDARLTNNPGASNLPSIAVSTSNVHLVWDDTRDGNDEIYYKSSTDGGATWGADTRLTNNSFASYYPSVAVSGANIHVVWYDGRDGNFEIYYKRSTDGGASWGTDTRLTVNTAFSFYPSVAVSGSNIHVVWEDERNGNFEIYYKRSTDGGISWGADTRITNDNNGSFRSYVTVSGAYVHVVWYDGRDENAEIYYKRDPLGNPVGITNIGSGIPGEFSLSQNYPNPFNPATKIRFEIPPLEGVRGRIVEIKIYDILGSEITTLVSEQLMPGSYEVDWNASKYSSGVYYYKLVAGEYTSTKKMVLIK